MVRLRALVGAMLGTGLIGFGISYPLGDTTSPSPPDHPCFTVRVPRFNVKAGYDVLTSGAESELTQAVVKAIIRRIAYKAVREGHADMELTGVITDFCCRSPPGGLHEGSDIREQETHLVVELTLRDLYTGESLLAEKDGSRPATVELRSIAYWRPELGESIKQPRRENLERIVDQIVLLMNARKAKSKP